MVCTWILIMKVWKEFSQGSQQIWQSSMQKQAAYVYMVFKKYHHMASVGLWHIKEELRKGFSKIWNKVPKHLNNKERRSYHPNHTSNINYLDKHGFLRIFVHKHQDDKHGIKHMQANHRRHVEQEQHTDSWVWFWWVRFKRNYSNSWTKRVER